MCACEGELRCGGGGAIEGAPRGGVLEVEDCCGGEGGGVGQLFCRVVDCEEGVAAYVFDVEAGGEGAGGAGRLGAAAA